MIVSMLVSPVLSIEEEMARLLRKDGRRCQRLILSDAGSILPPSQHLVVWFERLDVCAFPLRARGGGRISYPQVAFRHRHLLRTYLSGLLPPVLASVTFISF